MSKTFWILFRITDTRRSHESFTVHFGDFASNPPEYKTSFALSLEAIQFGFSSIVAMPATLFYLNTLS